ncbi:hit finger domain protein [Grosmannia clavigera kw1407]|uniref:Hit finger domain protein n=1 Tax=Grosmannia clavigera (strain kw1407 / UAMH 11150) TaxID=655863 RepID=F0XU16_GROCL|nr:hit finger domain protein [Grosmannia clavigera kw1407]EFW98726.1 hit finger domain protein [Grosmannia clavigera kw1407]
MTRQFHEQETGPEASFFVSPLLFHIPSQNSIMTASLDKVPSPEQAGVDETGDAALPNGKHQAPQNEDDKGEVSSETATESSEVPATKRRTLCGVCHNEAAKYKCPRCSLAYCSVACSRTHRDSHPPENDDIVTARTATTAAIFPTPTAPQTRRHPFSVLDDSVELKHLFSKYPHLQARLRAIYEATLPPALRQNQNEQQGPSWEASSRGRGRGGYRGGGRGGGGRGGSQAGPAPRLDQPWTTELGLRQGQKALRRARIDPGEDGDSVREYCELVTYLLARGEDDKNAAAAAAVNNLTASDAATALVQKEVFQGDVSLIKRLLETDGDH